MCETYKVSKQIRAVDLFNGRLGKYAIREQIVVETTPTCRFLCDQFQYNLLVNFDDQGIISHIMACSDNTNTAWIILDAIANEFNCDIQTAEEELHI